MFNQFIAGYIEALYFTEDDPPHELSALAQLAIASDCADFVSSNLPDLHEALTRFDATPESLGQDFWLTRNHHGAGYWDRGYGDLGDRLTDAANFHGAVDIYVNNDELEIDR